MSQLTYDYTQIEAAVTAMLDYKQKLQANLDELESLLAQLEGTWEAEAQQTYDAAQRAWNQATEQIANVTGKVQVAVQEAGDKMRNTDSANAARF